MAKRTTTAAPLLATPVSTADPVDLHPALTAEEEAKRARAIAEASAAAAAPAAQAWGAELEPAEPAASPRSWQELGVRGVGSEPPSAQAAAPLPTPVPMAAFAAPMRIWAEWAGQDVERRLEASRELIGCRSPADLLRVQGNLAQDAMRSWMDANSRILRSFSAPRG